MFNPCHACGRSQIHDVVYINSHQTVFHCVSHELLDRCRIPALARRAGRLSLLLYSPAQDGKHIKCFPLRAELATNLTAPPGGRAAETRSVQSNIGGTEFWLRICSRQRLNGQFPLCPSGSCGEIGTDFAVETFKQSLFHRTLQKGMKKRRGPRVESSPLLQGAMLFAYRGIRPGGR